MKPIQDLLPELHVPKKIVITHHYNPDADALGSTLGLWHYFKMKGHDCIVISPNAMPDFILWMPGSETVINFETQAQEAIKWLENSDYLFCLDFNHLSRTKSFAPSLEKFTGKKVMIDHHLSPDESFDFGISIPSVQLYYYLFLILALLMIVVSIRLQDSRIGRAWIAIREDEVAAKAMGINTRNVKLLAFAMGASFGGVSGAMFSAFQGFVSPESFVLMESIVIVAMVVLGGIGYVPGVILGAVLLYAIPEALRYVAKPIQETLFGQELIAPEALRMLLFGLAMVMVMLFRPLGLLSARRSQ
jgi:ABC-type branched-subunit amino acid transport system permease subunit